MKSRCAALLGLSVCGALAGAGPLRAAPAQAAGDVASQDELRVAGQVSAVAGASVYVDVGRDDRVEIGDRVLLHVAGAATVEGVVRSVSRSSARLELRPGSPAVAVGVRIEVLVPRERVQAETPAPVSAPAQQPGTQQPGAPRPVTPLSPDDPALQPPAPLHPPWTHPPEDWNRELPLLASDARPPDAPPPRSVHGRAWIDMRHLSDSVAGSNRYGLARVGTAFSVENPFGRGGELGVDLEGLARSNSFADQPSYEEQDLVVRRLAYAVGGTEAQPTRWQAGRFLSDEFPALGLVDGFEWSRRDARGGSVGFDVGGLPASFPDTPVGEDAGFALFGRWFTDEQRELSLGAALQKSWHEGRSDRDLLLLESEWQPSRSFSWRADAWVDHYGSGDALKSAGFELTEFATSARWSMAADWSATVSAAHRRYPELLRADFAGLSPGLIEDGRHDRAGLTLSHELTPRARLDARLDGWQDQDDHGTTGELSASWRDGWIDDGTLNVALFRADGSYSSGLGLRTSAHKSFGSVFGSLSYEFTDYEQKDFTGEQQNLAHHALYGSLDLALGERWNLALDAERRFGDEQDAWGVGLALRLRY